MAYPSPPAERAFPVWFQWLAAVLLCGYALFAAWATWQAWPAVSGREFDPYLYGWWMMAVLGGLACTIAGLVFAHATGVWQPMNRRRMRWLIDNPPPLPPYPKEHPENEKL